MRRANATSANQYGGRARVSIATACASPVSGAGMPFTWHHRLGAKTEISRPLGEPSP